MSSSLDVRPGGADPGHGRRVRLVASKERAAACSARLRMASDALAAADLLLGMNFSIGACGPAAPAKEQER